jgi:tagatose-6-phosphate ketose/aldose isomerase
LTQTLDALPDGGEWGPLLAPPESERVASGYGHTLREILQQPETWVATARQVQDAAAGLARALADGGSAIVLTGSGSSVYAGESAALSLQAHLGVRVQALAAGLLLTHAAACLPATPFTLISLARSGNSPESDAVVDLLLATRPDCRHLIVTCNAAGRLAVRHAGDPRVTVLVLDERTHDKSLVMTSSCTNLALAAGALGRLDAGSELEARVARLAVAGRDVLSRYGDALARVARSPFGRAIYLGSGAGVAATRESALKMLEITGGSVLNVAESFLGLRHGPMSAVHGDSLVVAFLSPDARVRAYELDVLRELARKGLGAARVIVGPEVPPHVLRGGDLLVSPVGFASLDEQEAAILHMMVGQLLAFFRCLHDGGRPDAPSPSGVIQRVVEEFAIYH